MSEWIKIEHAPDTETYGERAFVTRWLRTDNIAAIFVGAKRGDLTLRLTSGGVVNIYGVTSARFVNTTEAGPNNYFVTRSCGGCE